VVDDSALIRRTVTRLVEEDPSLEVVGSAADGRQALELVAELRPDVVSLDLDMPVMDGMTCLGFLVRKHRQRVVILSTLALESSFATFKALALGAVDFVTKPGPGAYLSGLDELGTELRRKIHLAAQAPDSAIGRRRAVGERLATRRVPVTAGRVVTIGPRLRAVVGVGGSTGGTVALQALLQRIPAFLPVALVAVQHIPSGFAPYYARYLDRISRFTVCEASDGALIKPHHAYIGLDGAHLLVQRTTAGLMLRTDREGAPERGYRPSINTLLYSLASAEREQSLGILLSGMGEDGVNGLEAIHRLGGHTLVQDRSSSVVFDMASRALERKVVHEVLPPEALAGAVHRFIGAGRSFLMPSEVRVG
jgi:two-component system chemotaxis response regulator CheB